jgi:hypothetical protein
LQVSLGDGDGDGLGATLGLGGIGTGDDVFVAGTEPVGLAVAGTVDVFVAGGGPVGLARPGTVDVFTGRGEPVGLAGPGIVAAAFFALAAGLIAGWLEALPAQPAAPSTRRLALLPTTALATPGCLSATAAAHRTGCDASPTAAESSATPRERSGSTTSPAGKRASRGCSADAASLPKSSPVDGRTG